MNPFGMRFARGNQPPLSPPITEEEERWWLQVRKRFYRQVALQFGVPYFLVFGVTAALTKPGKLFLAPLFAVMAFGASWLQARMMEENQRQQEVRWKRIRESLVAEPDQGDGAITSAQRDVLS